MSNAPSDMGGKTEEDSSATQMEAEMEQEGEKGEEAAEVLNDGEMAVDFALQDKDGNEFRLSEQKGKKVYVKFWASWCSVCLAGLEELNTLAGEQNDFEIVTVVAPDKNGEKKKEDFMKWFDSLGYSNIKVLFDETGEVTDSYGVRAYPTSAVIGSDGVLLQVVPGHLSNDVLKEAYAKIK